jgi:hypothetical protein
MGGSQSTVQQEAKFCLYQKEDFNTMVFILQDTKAVNDNLAEYIYSNTVPSVIQPFSKVTRNYFESLRYDYSKTITFNGKQYTLCSIADDIYVYNQLKEKNYKTEDADRMEHMKTIFLKSQQILKVLLEILYNSCEGNIVPGVLNAKAYNNLSLKDYYRLNPPALVPTPVQAPETPAVAPVAVQSQPVPETPVAK